MAGLVPAIHVLSKVPRRSAGAICFLLARFVPRPARQPPPTTCISRFEDVGNVLFKQLFLSVDHANERLKILPVAVIVTENRGTEAAKTLFEITRGLIELVYFGYRQIGLERSAAAAADHDAGA